MGYIAHLKAGKQSQSKRNLTENGEMNSQQMITPGNQAIRTAAISVASENDPVTIPPTVVAVVVKHHKPRIPPPPPSLSASASDSHHLTTKSMDVSKKRTAVPTSSTSNSTHLPRIIRSRRPEYKNLAWHRINILNAHQHKKLEVDMAVAAALPPNMGAFFTPAKITRNYNALYSSVAKALLGKETLQGQIRALVLEEMVRCSSVLRPFMRYHEMDFDLLLKHVKAANDGLNPVVIFIASEIIQRPIYVYEDFSPTTVRHHMIFNSNPAMESKYPLLLMFREGHIVPLIPACEEAPFPPITSRAFPAAKYKYLVAPPLTPPPPNVKLADLMPEIQMQEGEETLELPDLLDDDDEDDVEEVSTPRKRVKFGNTETIVEKFKELGEHKETKAVESDGFELDMNTMTVTECPKPIPAQCGICQLKLTTQEFMEHHNDFHPGETISIVSINMDTLIRCSPVSWDQSNSRGFEDIDPPRRPPAKRHPASRGGSRRFVSLIPAQPTIDQASGGARRRAPPSCTVTSQPNPNEEKEIEELRIAIYKEILSTQIKKLDQPKSTDHFESEVSGRDLVESSSDDDDNTGKSFLFRRNLHANQIRSRPSWLN